MDGETAIYFYPMTVISFTWWIYVCGQDFVSLDLSRRCAIEFVFQIDKITPFVPRHLSLSCWPLLNPLTYLPENTIGPTAAPVPLSWLSPFFARQVQVVLSQNWDGGVMKAAQASGATFWDIVCAYLREGLLI